VGHFAAAEQNDDFYDVARFQKLFGLSGLNLQIMRFGADVNAYTSFDETVYMLELPTDSLESFKKGFLVLEDWAHNLSFNDEEIDKERGVIIEEWRLGRGAMARMRDKQFPVLFKDSRYADRLPIGQRALLDTFKYETIKRFYHDWYRPDLMAVVVVGDFDVKMVENLIKQHFDSIPVLENEKPRKTYPVPDHTETLITVETDSEATQSQVGIFWKLPLGGEKTAGDFRQSIIESMYNSMLNKRMSELRMQEDPPFIFASSGKGRFVRSKEIYVLSATVKDNGIERGFESLLIEAKRAQLYGFTETELERQKKSILRSMERSYAERDKSESRSYAAEYIRNFLTDEPIPGIEYEYELYKQFVNGITLAEVNQIASGWISDTNRVIMVNLPEKEGIEKVTDNQLLALLDKVKAESVEPYVDDVLDEPLLDEMPTPSQIVEEKYDNDLDLTELKLSNGIRIFLKPTDFKNDQIRLTATSPGGLSLVPDSNLVAGLTATSVLMEGGIGKFNDIQLQKLLADKVVSANSFIGEITEGLYAGSSVKDLETMFQLLYLKCTEPRKDSTSFNSYQDRMKAMIKNRSLNPETAYSDTLNVTLTQHNPRYKPWSEETLDEMNLDKSLAIYRDRFADTGDFTFFIVGSFDPEKIKPLIEKYIGGLPVTDREETWKDVSFNYPSGVIEKSVYRGKEPKSKSTIIFTGDFEWNRQNRHVTDTMIQILQIKLREVLREDLGGTYSVQAYSSFEHYPKEEYKITLAYGSNPDRVEELKSAIFTQIDSLKNFPVQEKYLQKITEIQHREYETGLKENRFWLSNLEFKFFHNEPMSDILDYDQLVNSVTLSDIQLAAQKYFNMDNYVRVTLYPENWKGN